MPSDYFEFSQSPLVYISYSSELDKKFNSLEGTRIDSNVFANNRHMQVTVIEETYSGSLIQFESDIPNCLIDISNNLIE